MSVGISGLEDLCGGRGISDRVSLRGSRDSVVEDVLGEIVRYPASLTDKVSGDAGKPVGTDERKGSEAAVLMEVVS